VSKVSTPEPEPLLTTAEVATRFRVDSKTVTRWANAGKLESVRTLGGHRRFYASQVRALLAGVPGAQPAGRCPKCTYLFTSATHLRKCGRPS
jgi:excisionase family DNA binding protein